MRSRKVPFKDKEHRKEYMRKYHQDHKEKLNAYCRKYRLDNPGKRRENHLMGKYGISTDDYDRMLLEQGGRCAICGGTEPGGKKGYLGVDHDHDTGKIRGLLCADCNAGIGRLGDSPSTVRSALIYLEERRK